MNQKNINKCTSFFYTTGKIKDLKYTEFTSKGLNHRLKSKMNL